VLHAVTGVPHLPSQMRGIAASLRAFMPRIFPAFPAAYASALDLFVLMCSIMNRPA
jgi:hypothetical protein